MKRLTPAMKRRLIPFLPKLIRRFRVISRARFGDVPECPLCVDAGWYCADCPVFGRSYGRSRSRCSSYVPEDWYIPSGAKKVLDFLVALQKKTQEGKV